MPRAPTDVPARAQRNKRHNPYTRLIQGLVSTPTPFSVVVDSDHATNPDVNQLFLSTSGRWFNDSFGSGSQLRLNLTFRVVGRTDIPPLRISRVNVPSSVRVEGLPTSSYINVHAELDDVIELSTGKEKVVFPPCEGVPRVIHVFRTATSAQRALAHLLRGEASKFVSQVSCSPVPVGNQLAATGVDWNALRHAALMLSMPSEWRMFHLRYECSGLLPSSIGYVEYNKLTRNTLGVIEEEAVKDQSIFDLPVDHGTILAVAPRSAIIISSTLSPESIVRELTDDLNAIVRARRPITLSIALRSQITSHAVGDGVTAETLLRFCIKIIERQFVCIDGDWWFFSNTATSRSKEELKALAVAMMSLMQTTGAGPASFALPVVCAFAGTDTAPGEGLASLPACVRSVVDAVSKSTAAELEEMDLPACVSGSGWSVSCGEGKRLRASNRDEFLRRINDHFITSVSRNAILRDTVNETFGFVCGKYVVNGVTVKELQALLAGPETRLDTWREFTGVIDVQRVFRHDDVIDVLFTVLSDLTATEVARVARFWTGNSKSPRRENGQIYGCWVQITYDDKSILPVAHTCTKTLEIAARLIHDGPSLLRQALMKSVECFTSDNDDMIYSGD